MLNAATLNEFISDADAVAQLTGNCGKKVRRLLESTFAGQAATFTITGGADDLLVFAYQVERIDRACEMAETAAVTMTLTSFAVRRCEVDVPNRGISFHVTAKEPLPDGVKARQAFLYDMAFSLRRVSAMAAVCNAPTPDEVLERCFSDIVLPPESMLDRREQFDRLVAGDFTDFDSTPLILLELASYVAAGVADEQKRRDEEYDRIVNAALPPDADSSLDLTRLFAPGN